MTDISWHDLRTKACRRFSGQTPRATDEAVVMDAFERDPLRVIQAVDEIAEGVAAGRLRWGWSALAANVTRTTEHPSDLRVTLGQTPADAERRAADWIRTTGCQMPNADELLLELFGDRGRLRHLAQINLTDQRAPGHPQPDWKPGPPLGDTALVQRMRALWAACRQQGEDLDHQELERAAKWHTDRQAAIDNARPHPAPEPDLDPDHTHQFAASATVQDRSQ